MTSDGATTLALVLEGRFGARWFAHWEALTDQEARWLALYLAEQAGTGREFGAGEALAAILSLARLWPLTGYDGTATPHSRLDGDEVVPYL